MTPDPRLTDARASATMLGRVLVLLTLLIAAGVIGAIYHHADKDRPWTSSGTTTQQASTATWTHSSQPSTRQAATTTTTRSSVSTGASSSTRSAAASVDPLGTRTDTVLGWTAVVVAAGAVAVQAWRLGHDGGRGL